MPWKMKGRAQLAPMLFQTHYYNGFDECDLLPLPTCLERSRAKHTTRRHKRHVPTNGQECAEKYLHAGSHGLACELRLSLARFIARRAVLAYAAAMLALWTLQPPQYTSHPLAELGLRILPPPWLDTFLSLPPQARPEHAPDALLCRPLPPPPCPAFSLRTAI